MQDVLERHSFLILKISLQTTKQSIQAKSDEQVTSVSKSKRLKNGETVERFSSIQLIPSVNSIQQSIDKNTEKTPTTSRKSKGVTDKNGQSNSDSTLTNVDPRKTRPRLAHGVLQCTNCSTIWNRDDNSAINIRRCMISWILEQKRPEYLKRQKKSKFVYCGSSFGRSESSKG